MKEIKNVLKPRFRGVSMEKGGGKNPTETLDYVPLKERVMSLLDAGQTLQKARREMYHVDLAEDRDGRVDLRAAAPDTDIADLSELDRQLAQRKADIAARVSANRMAQRKAKSAASAAESGAGFHPASGAAGGTAATSK